MQEQLICHRRRIPFFKISNSLQSKEIFIVTLYRLSSEHGLAESEQGNQVTESISAVRLVRNLLRATVS